MVPVNGREISYPATGSAGLAMSIPLPAAGLSAQAVSEVPAAAAQPGGEPARLRLSSCRAGLSGWVSGDQDCLGAVSRHVVAED